MNKLIWSENIDCLRALVDAGTQLDFVYIDPPFFSNANYKATIKAGNLNLKTGAYIDKWDSIEEFIEMLRVRLILIEKLLKQSGTVAVHLDTHAVHYAKVMMDKLFGRENFVNDIVWCYKSGGARSKGFARKHDNILLYAKSKDFWFESQKQISYNRKGKRYSFKGVPEYQDADGRWYTLVNQKDVFDIDMVGRTSSERTGYATQKPEKLLEILLKSCCPEEGLAADFFCGSGTLGAVCHKLNRKFILCDASPVAIAMSVKRLSELGAEYMLEKNEASEFPQDLDPEIQAELEKYLY